jgi:hypothetical protein
MSIDALSGNKHVYDRHVADEEWSPSNEERYSISRESAEPGTSLLLVDSDIGAQVAALAILCAQQQQEANRAIQVAEDAALQSAEEEQVKVLHQRANEIRLAGAVDGVFGMGSGALAIGGGLESNQGDRQIFQGMATMVDAGGKALSSLPRANQVAHEASAAAHEHEAAHHRRSLDAARDAIREGQDLVEHALDFYKQSQRAASDAANISVRRG